MMRELSGVLMRGRRNYKKFRGEIPEKKIRFHRLTSPTHRYQTQIHFLPMTSSSASAVAAFFGAKSSSITSNPPPETSLESPTIPSQTRGKRQGVGAVKKSAEEEKGGLKRKLEKGSRRKKAESDVESSDSEEEGEEEVSRVKVLSEQVSWSLGAFWGLGSNYQR